MRKRFSILIIGILTLALLAGCRTAPDILPTDNPGALPTDGQGGPAVDLPANTGDDIEAPTTRCDFAEFSVSGEIRSIDESEDGDILGIIEVKGEPDNGATYDYAMVTITPDTEIYKNGAIRFGDLETGMYVNVFFDGAVAESYPVQGTAALVNVVTEEPAEE